MPLVFWYMNFYEMSIKLSKMNLGNSCEIDVRIIHVFRQITAGAAF